MNDTKDEQLVLVKLRAAILRSLVYPVQVEIVADVPRFSLWGESFGPYAKGMRVDVPKLFALALVKNGLARFLNENLELELFRLLSKEKPAGQHTAQLSPLPEDFYTKAFLALFAAEKAGLEERKNRLEALLQDLVTIRLSKIVRTISYTSVPQSLPGVTEEEKVLFNELSSLVKVWRETVRGSWLWR